MNRWTTTGELTFQNASRHKRPFFLLVDLHLNHFHLRDYWLTNIYYRTSVLLFSGIRKGGEVVVGSLLSEGVAEFPIY